MRTSQTARPFAAALVAVTALSLSAGPAAASPKPTTDTVVTSCPTDTAEYAAFLRSHGFTAQAANVIAQMTLRSCFRG
jgi:ABC-type sugar transport system substrate-binding protein